MNPSYLIVIAFMLVTQLANALPDRLDVVQWAQALSNKSDNKNEAWKKLDSLLSHRDSSYIFRFLDELESRGKTNDDYFQARFDMLKARQYVSFYTNSFEKNAHNPGKGKVIDSLVATSMDKAYSSGNDYLIAFVSYWYGRSVADVGLKVMYNLNNIALSEKLSLYLSPGDYQILADMLYAVKEYNDCIKYARESSAALFKPSDIDSNRQRTSCFNTIGLAFRKQRKYDSAFKYYGQALKIAVQSKDTIWIGIISGNTAQVYYELGNYDTARSFFTLDYQYSIYSGFYAEASNALQWLAKIDLASGNTQKALTAVREAFKLLKINPDAGYLRNIYSTAALVFKEMQIYDSAFYYNSLYFTLNDSLEKIVAANSLSISKARLNDEISRYKIQSLNREKQAEITTRNAMVAGVVLIAAIALLMINRKRLKAKLAKEKAEQENLLMQQEIVSVQEQLKMFRDNIVAKSALIAKLQQQQETKPRNVEQEAIVQEIIQQAILTEGDLLHFKTLFEKAHPGFFAKLREQVNDITVAEIRMAALTRMQLTTKQMADVLGISPNSIVKAKQRLRQRFNLPTNYEVEEFIAKL